jgi:glutamate-ammonia-ligase adenylyltransferase
VSPWSRADLEARLGDVPERERTLRHAEEVLAAAAKSDPARLDAAADVHGESLARVLRACCGVAPFLASHLTRRPALLFELASEDLARPRDAEALEARLARALQGVDDAALPAALRRFKYAELARITTRDATPELVPEARVAEVLAELSALAEVLLAHALTRAAATLEAEVGPPVWRDAAGHEVRLRFAVLGLGKLGGGELNYSSDVDLVYVHESPEAGAGPLEEGPRDLAPAEYFTRLARRLGKLVEEKSAEGFLYRVDLDLRPEGAGGPLVTSAHALEDYYDGWAATWEKAAFMKARPVAGDLEFGWRVARRIDPMIYQSSIDLAAVEGIRDMKARVEEEHDAADAPEGGLPDAWNVKLGAGGIRDVEFVAQALQLLHGGRIPQVRGRSAPGALRALAEVGVLPEAHAEELEAAWRFLRRVENRLQQEGERQVHRLPPPGAGRVRLARALGFAGDDETAAAAFEARIHSVRADVRARFDGLFEAADSDRILGLFVQAAPRLLAAGSSRRMLEDLAGRLADALAHSPDPERAVNNLSRFVEGVGGRTFYYGLLLDRPELVPRLAALFGASRYLSGILATHPELIEPVFDDPERLVASRAELERELAELRAGLQARDDRDPTEAALAALRLFQHRELVNVGLLDLDGKIGLEEVEHALTDVAEVCLDGALELARAQLPEASRASVDANDFLVVGMGKLGSRELSYGSDLDVIFLYDVPGAEGPDLFAAQEPFVRLAQKLGWALQTRTPEGVCYEVDARLRPSGNQGVLVTSLASFAKYHEGSAQVWERQALLRARPVAGSDRLGEAFERLRREILARPLPEGAEREIDRIRARMEAELAQEGGGHRNLKTGRGGLVDVEMVVQLLQLRHGAAHPELLAPDDVATQLGRIAALGLLPAHDVEALASGWRFLQRLSSRLRIVENRSIHDLSEERSDLDSVARALGYPPSQRTGTSRVPMLEDYRRHTEAIRRVYREVFPEAGEA